MKRYNYDIAQNKNRFAFDFTNYLTTLPTTPVFLCVGDTSVLTDCLGGMVGHLLKNKYNINAYIYGDLKQSINQNNLTSFYEMIKKKHPKHPIVVIDASLGNLEDVGTVMFNKRGAMLGGYTNKDAKLLGDASILGTLNTTGISSLLFLKSVKLSNLLKMADFIAESICMAFLITERLSYDKQSVSI